MSDYQEVETYTADEYQHPRLRQNFKSTYEDDLIITYLDEGDRLFHIQIFYLEEPENPQIVIEISIESDIYWVIRFEVDQESFGEFIAHQPLKKIQFEDFITKFQKALENVKTNRSSFSAAFKEQEEGSVYSLEIKQQLEFKKVTLFQIPFTLLENEDSEYLNEQAQYRYSYKLSQFNNEVAKLNELFEAIRGKSPKLYEQLIKSSKFAQK